MEIWKPIPGYVGLYEASSEGRIRSANGKVTSNARYSQRTWKSRIIKVKRTGGRRKDDRVDLWKDGFHKTHLVSRLVAAAWHGAPADGMTVNHINGNPLDNRPQNLEWLPLRDNIRHGYSSGLYKNRQRPVTLAQGATERTFPSMAEADRFLGRRVGYTSNAVAHGRDAVSAEGNTFAVRPF